MTYLLIKIKINPALGSSKDQEGFWRVHIIRGGKNMENSKNILIIGGGYGGIETAKKLAKRYKKRPDVSITLVDKHPFHTLMTELHEVAGHRVDPDAVRISFSKVFGASKVRVVLDTIDTVDFENRRAISAHNSYPYDYLVIGSGAEPDFFGVPGVQENSLTLWSFDDALRIRSHIETTFERAVAEQDPEKRAKLLTFVVAGAGFTGIELAGELIEWRDVMCAKWLVNKGDVKIIVVEAMASILPILEEDLRQKVEAYMRKKGADLRTNAPIVGAEPGIVKLKDGSTIETGTFIWTCGVQGSAFAESLPLTKGQIRKKGRILVTDEMRSVDHDNVFLVGDNLWFIENAKSLPQIVETALQTAEVAAHNVAAAIDGTEVKKFKSNYHGFMISVGGKYAVSNAGGIKLSGFFAQAMKHLVNLHYFLGVAGINQCWEYVKNEFLDMRHGRSILRGLAAYKTRGYWLFPLRLWLGLTWLMEGINKIGEGWLAWSTGTKSSWMFSKGIIQAGMAKVAAAASGAASAAATAVAGAAASGAASDAVSAASEQVVDSAGAVASGAAAVSSAPVWSAAVTGAANAAGAGGASDAVSAASDQVVNGATSAVSGAADAVNSAAHGATQAVAHAFAPVWDMTKPIFSAHGVVATWFRTTFMDGIFSHVPFQLFQLMVVGTEMAIGLALIGGLFTWWAAVASIAMCFVFTLSGMFTWDQVWFIFAGFLMLGGAGRAIGLDCWVVPRFKKWWNGTKFARKHYFYLDGPSK